MTEEQLKKLHTAMQNDNEHQCNKLYNYIHTDVFLTAEVVQVVREIVAEETKELQEENAELNQKVIDLENDREIFLSDFYCDKKGTCKFTEAKEIIRTFLNMPMPSNEEVFADVGAFLTKAEQFLKDSKQEE